MSDRVHTTADAADDDWLEQALRGAAHDHADYISDDGFTAKVMHALPAPVALPGWRRPALVALWGTAGLGAMATLPQVVPELTYSLLRTLSTQSITLTQIGTAIVALAAASWAGTLYTLRRD
jgi:hypothetical protein